MKIVTLFILLIIGLHSQAQLKDYKHKLKSYQDNYVATHEVVNGEDKKYFRFFPVDSRYRVNATIERIIDTTGFIMITSEKKRRSILNMAV